MNQDAINKSLAEARADGARRVELELLVEFVAEALDELAPPESERAAGFPIGDLLGLSCEDRGNLLTSVSEIRAEMQALGFRWRLSQDEGCSVEVCLITPDGKWVIRLCRPADPVSEARAVLHCVAEVLSLPFALRVAGEEGKVARLNAAVRFVLRGYRENSRERGQIDGVLELLARDWHESEVRVPARACARACAQASAQARANTINPTAERQEH